jgi:hypothetical protein
MPVRAGGVVFDVALTLSAPNHDPAYQGIYDVPFLVLPCARLSSPAVQRSLV